MSCPGRWSAFQFLVPSALKYPALPPSINHDARHATTSSSLSFCHKLPYESGITSYEFLKLCPRTFNPFPSCEMLNASPPVHTLPSSLFIPPSFLSLYGEPPVYMLPARRVHPLLSVTMCGPALPVLKYSLPSAPPYNACSEWSWSFPPKPVRKISFLSGTSSPLSSV